MGVVIYDIAAHVKAHGCSGHVSVSSVVDDYGYHEGEDVACADCRKTIHPVDRAEEPEPPKPCGCVRINGPLAGAPCEKRRWHSGPHRITHGDGYAEWA